MTTQERRRAYSRGYQAALKSVGICSRCRCKHDNGTVQCLSCMKTHGRVYRKKFPLVGICHRCRTEPLASHSRSRCAKCLAKANEYQKRHNQQMKERGNE